jgi:hypothetical protein
MRVFWSSYLHPFAILFLASFVSLQYESNGLFHSFKHDGTAAEHQCRLASSPLLPKRRHPMTSPSSSETDAMMDGHRRLAIPHPGPSPPMASAPTKVQAVNASISHKVAPLFSSYPLHSSAHSPPVPALRGPV